MSLDSKLDQLAYAHRREVREAISNLTANSRSLVPEIGTLIADDGMEYRIIVMTGTLAITYQRLVYNIPIEMYIPEQFPTQSPITYVRPTSNMVVKSGPNVLADGLVVMQYTDNWNSSSTLVEAITIMSSLFSSSPPLYSKPTTGVVQPAPRPPISGYGYSTGTGPAGGGSGMYSTPGYPTNPKPPPPNPNTFAATNNVGNSSTPTPTSTQYTAVVGYSSSAPRNPTATTYSAVEGPPPTNPNPTPTPYSALGGYPKSNPSTTNQLTSSPSINVASYNILTSNYATPSSYPDYDPNHLNAETRLTLIKQKLSLQIAQQSIISLQEVSHKFFGELLPFFAKNDYHFIPALYGNKWSGYMGIGVAVPLKRFEIIGVDITKAADTLQFNKFPTPAPTIFLISFMISLWNSFSTWVLKYFTKPIPDPWADANGRNNQIVTVTLKCKLTQKSFVVANYHMPCMYKFPQVMVIHSALYANHVQRLAKDLPYILTGDFNFKPDSSMYQLYERGLLENNHPENPAISNKPGTHFCKLEVRPVRSAYKTKLGSEPKFTNFSRFKMEELFIDTLDYIFVSDEWFVRSVLSLPTREDLPGKMPNAVEPSDHLMIAADLSLVTSFKSSEYSR